MPVAAAAAAAAAARGSAVVAVAAAAAAGGAAGGGGPLTYIGKKVFNIVIGDKIKQWIPISRKKVAAWRQFLTDESRSLHQQCLKVISEETNRMINEAKIAQDETSKQIAKLKKSEHHLTELATDLKKTGKNVEEIKATFDTMLSE